MEMNLGLILQTKQVMSQAQVQSLNILSMSMTELQDFLQKEEIENPIVECTNIIQEEQSSIVYREYVHGERSYVSGTNNSSSDMGSKHDRDTLLNEYSSGRYPEDSVRDMVFAQLSWNQLSELEQKIIDFCIDSLDQNGYLTISGSEIAKRLHVDVFSVEQVILKLKELEPRGIFSFGLKECLLSQIRGLENEALLEYMIENHLEHIADGRISVITRGMKISSTEARLLIQVIKNLNPRPLNGYGEERAQFILPDVIISYQDAQWAISLNDRWTGNFGISDFYVNMMKNTEDEELRTYFEGKLRRARFIIKAIEQRRQTLLSISKQILIHQEQYLLGHGSLQIMTMEQIAKECNIHKSTVSRAIREKYLLAPKGCMPMRELFSTGVGLANGNTINEGVSRNVAKEKLRALIEAEDKAKPYSDEQIVELLKAGGIAISRRTVAKYRAELGIKGAFHRCE